MSFSTKDDRKKCWDSRDHYWDCLDTNQETREGCLKLRLVYEASCPSQWVKHFDRKRNYLKFKDRIEKDGIQTSPSVVHSAANSLQVGSGRHRVYRQLFVCREESYTSSDS